MLTTYADAYRLPLASLAALVTPPTDHPTEGEALDAVAVLSALADRAGELLPAAYGAAALAGNDRARVAEAAGLTEREVFEAWSAYVARIRRDALTRPGAAPLPLAELEHITDALSTTTTRRRLPL